MHAKKNRTAADIHEYDTNTDHEPGMTLSDTIASSGLSLIVGVKPEIESPEDDLRYSSQFALPVYRFRNGRPSQKSEYCAAFVEFLDRMHQEGASIFPITNDKNKFGSVMQTLNKLMEGDPLCGPKLQDINPISRSQALKDLHSCGYLDIERVIITFGAGKREDITKIQLGSPDSQRAAAAREQRELETVNGIPSVHGDKMLVEDKGKLLNIHRLGLVDLDGLMQSKNAIYLCRKITNRFFLPSGGDKNEIMQAARIGIAKAFRDFEPGHDSEFWSFAELCAVRQVITEVKNANREKHSVLNNANSLEAPFSPSPVTIKETTLGEIIQDPRSYDPVDVAITNELIEKMFYVVEGDLTEIERVACFGCIFMGFSYKEVIEYMSDQLDDPPKDTKAVDNALQRVRRKIKQHITVN